MPYREQTRRGAPDLRPSGSMTIRGQPVPWARWRHVQIQICRPEGCDGAGGWLTLRCSPNRVRRRGNPRFASDRTAGDSLSAISIGAPAADPKDQIAALVSPHTYSAARPNPGGGSFWLTWGDSVDLLLDMTGGQVRVGMLAVGPLDGGTVTELPGLQTFKGLVLGLIPYALVACVAAFVIGAILWAVGAFGHNPQHSSKGKTTLVVALAAAMLVGGAAYLVGWFNDRGKEVSAPASTGTPVVVDAPALTEF